MKSLLLLSSLFLLSPNISMAKRGQDKGNGGDICENKMRNITNSIEEWLIRDEYKGLKLPDDLSEENYKEGMLDAAKKSILSCVTEKVFIGMAEKTCKNFEGEDQSTQVVCNFDRFMKTEEKEQYRLVHHELAGVAGFETNKGEEASVYFISNQISEFLQKEMVYKLGIKMTSIEKTFVLKDMILVQELSSTFFPWKPRVEKFAHVYQGDALTFCQYKGYDDVKAFEMKPISLSDLFYLKLNKYESEDPRFLKNDLSIVELRTRIDGTFYTEFRQVKLEDRKAYTKITCVNF